MRCNQTGFSSHRLSCLLCMHHRSQRRLFKQIIQFRPCLLRFPRILAQFASKINFHTEYGKCVATVPPFSETSDKEFSYVLCEEPVILVFFLPKELIRADHKFFTVTQLKIIISSCWFLLTQDLSKLKTLNFRPFETTDVEIHIKSLQNMISFLQSYTLQSDSIEPDL